MIDPRDQLRVRLSSIVTPLGSDSGRGGVSFSGPEQRDDQQAAVLVPIVGGATPTVWFTVRSMQAPHHAGQVALPGGRHEPPEPFPMATALREAEEELGLSPDSVEVLGQLPTLNTLTGFEITPIVGWIDEAPQWVACDKEVHAVFSLPLAHILDPNHYSQHLIHYRRGRTSRSHRVWSLRGEHWPIWGATALILARLAGFSETEPRAED